MPVQPTVTPRPTLSTPNLKYVCDVAFDPTVDTAGVIPHGMGVNHPIVIVEVITADSVTAEAIIGFTDANNLSITTNLT